MCGTAARTFYDHKVRQVRDLSCGDTHVYLEIEVRRVWCPRCAAVKQEKIPWLADNPFYTKRFAFFVGRRCRTAPVRDVARELHLDWKTVKELEKQYMREQLRKAGTPGPRIIGIDEIAIRKGHTYRIVVSDLLRRRVLWFGGRDRSEASMAQFYAWLGQKKAARIRLAVMDMWKPFRNATTTSAPQAAILFDKFHITCHLGDALDAVRKAEYRRLSALTAATVTRQWEGLPVHEWSVARIEEGRAKTLHDLRIEEFMTTDLFTVHPDEPLTLVVHLMDWKHVRHIPVENEQGKLAGIISWLEIVRHYGQGNAQPEAAPIAVAAVMQSTPVTVPPETSVLDAIALMRKERLDYLLVVKDDHLVGIVTEHDVLHITAHLLEQQVPASPHGV